VKLLDVLSSVEPSEHGKAYLEAPGGQRTEIPASIFDILVRVARDMAQGHAVVIMPVEHELTTQEAADLLNVSRPFLVKLLERGEIDHHLAGTHRRIYLQDLTAYRARRDSERRRALDELAQDSGKAGLEY
jgi:excisionase family DNA binding protein